MDHFWVQINIEKAQNALRIQSVNLRNSSIEIRDDVDIESLERSNLQAQSFRGTSLVKEFESEPDASGNLYKFTYQIGLRLISKEEKDDSEEGGKPILEVLAQFEAVYFSDGVLVKECLDAFSEDNVGFNVWPFWRELVQSYCCRVGFHPPIDVPLYRLNKRPTEEKE